MHGARDMLSVGVDVGTTTTQVVLSRLTVRNSRRLGLVPRLEVDTRAVLYQSRPHPTPLLSPEEVDVVMGDRRRWGLGVVVESDGYGMGGTGGSVGWWIATVGQKR